MKTMTIRNKGMSTKRCDAIAWYMIANQRFLKSDVMDMLNSGYFQSVTGIEISEAAKELICHKVSIIARDLRIKASKKCAYAFPDADL